MRLIQKGLGKCWSLGLWRFDTYWGHNETQSQSPVRKTIKAVTRISRRPYDLCNPPRNCYNLFIFIGILVWPHSSRHLPFACHSRNLVLAFWA